MFFTAITLILSNPLGNEIILSDVDDPVISDLDPIFIKAVNTAARYAKIDLYNGCYAIDIYKIKTGWRVAFIKKYNFSESNKNCSGGLSVEMSNTYKIRKLFYHR